MRVHRVVVSLAFVAAAVPLNGKQDSSASGVLLTAAQAESIRIAWNNNLGYVPGEVLVKFHTAVNQTARTRAVGAVRGGIDASSTRWIGDVLWTRSQSEPDAEALAETLRRQPEVQWAQPNYVRRLSAVPNDPGYSRQWNFDLISVPRAWDIAGGGSDQVVVAVVDTGIATTTQSFDFKIWNGATFETTTVPFRMNPDLRGERIAAGRDFVFWSGPVIDMVGHGTHVAGTALQETNNGLGLAGIAHSAHLLPLKACIGYWELQFALSDRGIPAFVRPDESAGCPDAAVAQAIEFAADSGVQVINLSLGGPDPAPVLLEALRYAVDRGVFVAIAAGNEFTEGNPVTYPASYAAEIDGVVSVGAVGRSGRRAFYSNTGPYIELAAPGGDVLDGGAPAAVYQSSLFGSDFDPRRVIRPSFDRYAEVGYQGTSMAAPHVAGVAALLYARGVTQPSAVESRLKSVARDLGTPGRDSEFGFGLIDAPAALAGTGQGQTR
jgi:serine protease